MGYIQMKRQTKIRIHNDTTGRFGLIGMQCFQGSRRQVGDDEKVQDKARRDAFLSQQSAEEKKWSWMKVVFPFV